MAHEEWTGADKRPGTVRLVKQSLGQEATALLRKMLLDGRFAAGERMVEGQIAEELGISRTPLREALHRLAQEGMLEKRPAGGYQVRKLKRSEVEDAIALRSMLESHAARLAATRATPEEVRALRANLAQFDAASAQGDLSGLVEVNTAFHMLLRTAAHSPLLLQLLEEMDGVVERMLRPLISLNEADWNAQDHTSIVDAVEAGAGEAAARAMQAHVEHGREKILPQLGDKAE